MFFRTIFLSTAVALAFVLPAYANPFDVFNDVRSIFNSVNSSILNANDFLNQLGYTAENIKSLGQNLGIDLENIDASEAKSGDDVAVAIYREWSNTLSTEDAEIVQQLILEYAASRVTSIEEMMISGWYEGLPNNRKTRVIGLFGKFNQILELVDDKNAFLAGVFLEE